MKVQNGKSRIKRRAARPQTHQVVEARSLCRLIVDGVFWFTLADVQRFGIGDEQTAILAHEFVCDVTNSSKISANYLE